MAAIVPKTVATSEETIATKTLFQSDAHKSLEPKISFSYHTSENFVQVVSLASLNE